VDEESIPLFLQFAQDHSPDGDFIHPLSLRQGGDGGLKGGMADFAQIAGWSRTN
jgi:hypothetical protein